MKNIFALIFGMVSRIQYYTGIIFQAYTYGTGEPLVKGGRYNELLKHFGALPLLWAL